MPLVLDAKYLAESLQRFQGCGEVRISERGALIMLANYQRLIEAVGNQGRVATAEVIEHPTVVQKPAKTLDELRERSLDRLDKLHESLTGRT
jgi:hypothetical protein